MPAATATGATRHPSGGIAFRVEAAAANEVVRRHIEITGAVQGVGFRPWVYQLAHACGLAGSVCNSTAGVTIEAEGSPEALERFLARLRQNPPPLARIEAIALTPVPPGHESGFRILPSRSIAATPAQVAPDTAPCALCRADYLSPSNRRAGYVFTNCTHCGPRYTITLRLPYDRPSTTMAGFAMCAPCQSEYDTAADRRFHAQPNACPSCGPELSCDGRRGNAALAYAAARLRQGAIAAIKNVGGYQLACDAANETAVARLRAAKRRGRKPFALLALDLAAARQICLTSPEACRMLDDPARPIVLLPRRSDSPLALAPSVAPGQQRLGLMLPSSPLHELLLLACRLPLLVMTSGNRGSLPLASSESDARMQLTGVADLFLDHNRPIHARADDSVLQLSAGAPRLLRRARGYVPRPIALDRDGATVWAAGAEMKNVFCLARGAQAFLSPHLGDVGNAETWSFYKQTLKHYLSLLDLRPTVLVLDAHPGFRLNAWARPLAAQLGIGRVLSVQHHHAHIAACMAEHHLDGPILGVAWDGTGYGADATVWGGEFLLASRARFTRLAHLRPVTMVGGDQAVREPWRLALAYLRQALGDAASDAAGHLWPRLSPMRLRAVWQLLQPRPGSSSAPFTVACTSAGRLFDAVAAILGLAPEDESVSFDGEAAMAVENAALRCPAPVAPYPFALAGDPLELDFAPMFAALVGDRLRGIGIESLAARVHATLTKALVDTCRQWRTQCGNRIGLSGGVFQNQILLEAAVEQLRTEGFTVYVPRQVPMNDGGLALGQAVIARAQLMEEQDGVSGHPREDSDRL